MLRRWLLISIPRHADPFPFLSLSFPFPPQSQFVERVVNCDAGARFDPELVSLLFFDRSGFRRVL